MFSQPINIFCRVHCWTITTNYQFYWDCVLMFPRLLSGGRKAGYINLIHKLININKCYGKERRNYPYPLSLHNARCSISYPFLCHLSSKLKSCKRFLENMLRFLDHFISVFLHLSSLQCLCWLVCTVLLSVIFFVLKGTAACYL